MGREGGSSVGCSGSGSEEGRGAFGDSFGNRTRERNRTDQNSAKLKGGQIPEEKGIPKGIETGQDPQIKLQNLPSAVRAEPDPTGLGSAAWSVPAKRARTPWQGPAACSRALRAEAIKMLPTTTTISMNAPFGAGLLNTVTSLSENR